MTKRGRIIVEDNSLKSFKEKADNVWRYANVISRAFLVTFGVVHIMYSEAMRETLQKAFGGRFIEG